METITWGERADKSSLVHRIQAVHDGKRKLEEVEEEVKAQLAENEREKKRLKQEEKKLFINLIKSKKISFVHALTLDDLRKYLDSDKKIYVIEADTSEKQFLYVKGEEELSNDEYEHWELFYKDYFYYGNPNYKDVNDPNDEMSERELGEESGSWSCKLLELN